MRPSAAASSQCWRPSVALAGWRPAGRDSIMEATAPENADMGEDAQKEQTLEMGRPLLDPMQIRDAWAEARARREAAAAARSSRDGDQKMDKEGGDDSDVEVLGGSGVAKMVPRTPPGMAAPAPSTPRPGGGAAAAAATTPPKPPQRRKRREEEEDPDTAMEAALAKHAAAKQEEMVQLMVGTPAFQEAICTAMLQAVRTEAFRQHIAGAMQTATAGIHEKIDITEKRLQQRADKMEREMAELKTVTATLQQQLREGPGIYGEKECTRTD